jgi:hypothetical protein
VSVRVNWPKRARARFDIVQVRFVSRRRAAALGVSLTEKLKIEKTRGNTFVAITVTKLKPGTMQFGVKALKLGAPTTVTVRTQRR